MISDVRGKSGRAMIKALIAGERDPAKLARLADPRLKASPAQLSEALRGRVTKNHRFLLRLHLRQIDALDAAIAAIDRQVEANIAPFRTAVKRLISIPGVKALAAQVALSEFGFDMSRFPSAGHLIGLHLSAQRRECGQASLQSPAQRCALTEDDTGPIRMGGGQQEGQLIARPVLPHQGAPRPDVLRTVWSHGVPTSDAAALDRPCDRAMARIYVI